MNNEKYNHYHGDEVRKQWPIGTVVSFKPKNLSEGEMRGIVTGHMYVNVLTIKDDRNRVWYVSTLRCKQKATPKELWNHFLESSTNQRIIEFSNLQINQSSN
ncbi:MAG: hypothetical protein HOP30_14725 [Cyclobacteriaceae bacterium]|nr:hypothetical protein [Cyclobacteriaceae bacterium]